MQLRSPLAAKILVACCRALAVRPSQLDGIYLVSNAQMIFDRRMLDLLLRQLTPGNLKFLQLERMADLWGSLF